MNIRRRHVKACLLYFFINNMRRLLIYLTGALLMLIGCEKQGTVVVIEKWPDGAKKIVHEYYSKEDSTFTEYGFFENGGRMYIREFEVGLQEGVYVDYHDNGARKSLTSFLHGQVHGDFLSWYETGEVYTRRSFDNGVMTALANFYQNGQIIGEVVVENGEIVSGVYYYEDGTRRSEGKIKNGQRSGTWKTYDDQGELKEVLEYN